jgi:hypothetical protein
VRISTRNGQGTHSAANIGPRGSSQTTVLGTGVATMDCYDALPRQTTRLDLTSKQSRSLVSSSVVLPATSFEELLFIVPASNLVGVSDAKTRFLVQGSCPRVLMQQEFSVDFLHSDRGSWREWMLDLHHAWNDHSYSCRLRVARSRLSAIAASKSWASRQKKGACESRYRLGVEPRY